MFQLEKNGYEFLGHKEIWSKKDYHDISYSDGDYEENRLAEIIASASDISIFSSELRNHCTDWQSLYHLSSQRGNILRPFKDRLKGRVLEIGAGCGAITRFLGENGGEILALEGSTRRASIAASRTRDLNNVTILAERFDDFEIEEKFDAITLIGVLEYASMFSTSEHAAYTMLSKIKKLLKPNGYLFIAIENQLGLKYFAGAPEDHLYKAMYGIEGRYKNGEPETYGKVTLQKLLNESGYNTLDFFAPFPDYKMPTSIITEIGCNTTEFDAAAFAWQTVAADPQLPSKTHFSLIHTWPVIFKNKLGMDFANSFLVAATPADINAINTDVLAYHYSTSRKVDYVKETLFSFENNEINIRYFYECENLDLSKNKYISKCIENPTYHKGLPLNFEFINLFTSKEWSIDDVIKLVNKYLECLKTILIKEEIFLNLDSILPGNYIDAVPQNIIIDGSGQAHLFDNEWIAPDTIELGYLLFRGLLLLINQSFGMTKPLKQPSITRKEFVLQVMQGVGLRVDNTDLERFNIKEVEFQQQVMGLNESLLVDWHPNDVLVNDTIELVFQTQLYYRKENQSFGEKNSIVFPARYNQLQKYSFLIKNDNIDSTFIRLDPMDVSGWIWISSLVVTNQQGDTLWILQEDNASFLNITPIGEYCNGMIFYADSNDPQIIITEFFSEETIIVNVAFELLDSLSVAKVILSDELLTKNLKNQHYNLINIEQENTVKIEKMQQELQVLKSEIDVKNIQMVNYAEHIQILNNTVHELRCSTSWKVSKPLRMAGVFNIKTQKAYRLIIALIKKYGLKAICKKGFYFLSREGVSGIIARLKQQHKISVLQDNINSIPSSASISYDKKSGYSLKSGHSGYCYVEPARPIDLAERIEAIKSKPFFTIVIPVYNTPLDLLDPLINSITSQWYSHWELILVDDCSPDPNLQRALDQISHSQIKIIRAESNSGISGATNMGINEAKGDFILFADHDDELTVDCLYEIALCIEQEQPDFIYSDEDKLTEEGNYIQPHFKPDWSPDTMMSTMFTCHASCVRRTLLEKTGLLRSEFDGCQDWDFVLRVAEHTNRIHHIDKVLYHWRMIPASVASDIAAKPYVTEISRQVRIDALKRRGLEGTVEPVTEVPGYFRINYHVTGTPLISIVIPTRDNVEVLRRCLDSIFEKTQYDYYEVIVVDNGSVLETTLDYFKELHKYDRVKVIRHDIPFNFSELNNVGVNAAEGDILLFLNDDTEVMMSDWLERMAGYAQLAHVGAVGAKLLYPGTQQIQHAGVLNLQNGPMHAFLYHDAYSPGYFMRNLLEYNWLAVTGACLMIERKKYEKISGFDESLPIAYNDVELCFKAVNHGFYNVVCQAVTLYHHESISRGLDHIDPIKQERLNKELCQLYVKHPHFYQYDPFYNINLAPNGINFDLNV